MKKAVYLLLLISTFAHSQISDVDAKLQYQKAEEEYNTFNYYNASQTLADLEAKMGNSTAKVLYLYLKCVYATYEFKEYNGKTFDKSYNIYKTLFDKCNTFFELVDKANYPSNKYDEIVNIKNYFEAKTKEFENQKDRKPQDAIDFLNICAKKFGENTKSGQGYNIFTHWETTYSLQNSTLIVSSIFHKFDYYGGSKDKDSSEHGFREVQIDLTKASLKNIFITSLSEYNARGEKEYTGIKVKENISSIRNSNLSVYKDFKSESFKNSTSEYYIYENFISENAEYKNENYSQRIKDAIQFLIDYFPKNKEENASQTKSKF